MSYITDVARNGNRLMRENPKLRTGQAYFNALYAYDREQANRITNTSLDPFYSEDNFERFMVMLGDKGDSITKIQM